MKNTKQSTVKNASACVLMAALVMSVSAYAGTETNSRENAEVQTKANTHAMTDYTGSYYLQGVMEVGSAFRLQPDGKFQFMLTYGAVDREASGTWEKTDTGVTLTSISKPSEEKTKVNASRAWDRQAEEEWLEVLYDEHEEKLRKRCRMLYPSIAPEHPPIRLSSDEVEFSLEQLKAFDADITRMEKEFSATLKKLAAQQSKTLTTTKKSQQSHLARGARALYKEMVMQDRKLRRAYYDYNAARYQGDNAKHTQQRDVYNIPNYKRPMECINRFSTRASENPSSWKGGDKGGVVAVIVYSGKEYNREETVSRVSLRFEFSDGTQVNARIDGGYALTRKPAAATLERVVLIGLKDKENGTENTTVNITSEQPVQEIKISLPPPTPAFDMLRLVRTDEDTLVPSHGKLKGKEYVRMQ